MPEREAKPPWSAVPRAVKAEVARILGSPVASAERMYGGYAPSATFRLVLRNGRRAFLKSTYPLPKGSAVIWGVAAEERAYRALGARLRPRGRGSRMARRRLPAAPGGRAAPRTRARAPHASPPRHAVGQPARPARTAPLRLELRLRGTAGARRRRVRAVDHGRRRAGAGAVRRGVSRAARPRRPSPAPGDLGDRRPVRPARARAADPGVAAAALDPAPAAPVVARLGGAPRRSARAALARGGPGLTCRSGPTPPACAAGRRRLASRAR